MAVSHLVERGHERIAYLGADLAIATAQASPWVHRRPGRSRARLRVGDRSYGSSEYRRRGARRRSDLRRRHGADGAALCPELLHDRAYKALRTRDLWGRSPSSDSTTSLAEMLDPPVTVVAHDPVELGLTAAQLLFRRLDGDRSTSEHIVCPVQLVPRGSGEIEPAAAR